MNIHQLKSEAELEAHHHCAYQGGESAFIQGYNRALDLVLASLPTEEERNQILSDVQLYAKSSVAAQANKDMKLYAEFSLWLEEAVEKAKTIIPTKPTK